jgi:SAM-dependent methyltransferase
MSNAMINTVCPLCGADDYNVRYPATAPAAMPDDSENKHEKGSEYFRCTSHHLAEHGDIVKCNRCGMLYNNPQPHPETLLDIYKEVEDPLYLEESGARERTFERSLEQLHGYIHPPGKLLDVGCYTGSFMQVAKRRGWDVFGMELSGWAADAARKTETGPVYSVPLDRLPVPPGTFDVVTFWDVMEHLADPKGFLNDIAKLVKPGGLIGFSTHMTDSWAVKLMGTKYPFFMDMHVVHFSRVTVRRVLEEQGFELLGIAAHRRILRLGYFLEKLAAKIPVVRPLSKWKWLSERYIRIGLLGLVNIFARAPGGLP